MSRKNGQKNNAMHVMKKARDMRHKERWMAHQMPIIRPSSFAAGW